ncbi:CASP-like protein 1U3 [Dichanthelium oligosanthes]|uniref:CASP-like protein n=1 Tax=Dichanthelium oligosanthes TaxID=888268 RepID=A0A1E5UYF9_9POAL|nr:CASP-like protein 1U3 [Dichanthelium oligosanthes]
MHDEEKKESKCAMAVSIAGRIAGMGLAVASAVLMATASQCTVYAAYGERPRTVTYSNYPPFVYLLGANSIAAFLEAIAIFLVVWKKGKDNKSKVMMPLLGAAVPALLYSATGAAFAASSDMSYCSAYGKRVSVCAGSAAGGSSNFCSQVHISVYLSLAAAIVVSVAEVLRGIGGSGAHGGCDSDSSSSSDSGGCDHGCHHKH